MVEHRPPCVYPLLPDVTTHDQIFQAMRHLPPHLHTASKLSKTGGGNGLETRLTLTSDGYGYIYIPDNPSDTHPLLFIRVDRSCKVHLLTHRYHPTFKIPETTRQRLDSPFHLLN